MWHVHEEPYDFYRYTKFGLKYMFDKAGFKEVVVEAQTGFWVNWFVNLNYQLIKINNKTWFRKKVLMRFINKFIYYNQKWGVWLDKRWHESEGETQGYFVTAKNNRGNHG